MIHGTTCCAENVTYGVGKPGQVGVSALASQPPVLGALFTMSLQQALPSAVFLMLLGSQPDSTPFDGGTMLVATNSGFIAATNATGSWQQPFALPDEPALCGATLYAQVWVPNDPGAAGAGWAASNGLRITLGH